MYSMIKRDTDIAYNVNEYICNSVNDLAYLSQCAPGSIAIILEENSDAAVYMKNPEGKWVKI